MTVRLIDLNNMVPLFIELGISIIKHEKEKQVETKYRQENYILNDI